MSTSTRAGILTTVCRAALLFLFSTAVAVALPGQVPSGSGDRPDSASAPESGGCTPSAETLCLLSGRFAVAVTWRNQHVNPVTTGVGSAVPSSDQTGFFWFFNPSSIELVVKMVDGRGLNGKLWVFYGALSDVEYTITVTDKQTGLVKTYHNTPGNICGWADTSAFSDTSGASSLDEPAGVEPPVNGESLSAAFPLPAGHKAAPAAASSCVASEQNLCLLSGRFQVSVAWKNQHSSGQTGDGTAIPSTDQSGYFWFFNPDSIELVVKIVDGSALNHSFWIFYGALSDVEYTITVTDTQTGTVATYHNAPGNICGSADTKFSLSVTAQLDSSRAVSQVIPPEGGTISTTAADGTVFTLTLPAGALLSEEEITLTPVASFDHFPLSGGLSAAVQLAPEGLLLFQPATLVINSPTAIPADEEITFAWHGTGQQFFLYPPDPLPTPSITFGLTRFSGYGAGRGTSADQAAQQAHLQADPDDQLAQDLQGPAADERAAARSGGSFSQIEAIGMVNPSSKTPASKLTDAAIKVLTAYFLNVLHAHQPTKCSDDWEGFLNELRQFEAQVNDLTAGDPTLLQAVHAYYGSVYTLLAGCYDKAYDLCKSNLDPEQGVEMFRILQVLQSAGAAGAVVPGKISSCLTFKLDFSSFIQETQQPGLLFAFNHLVGASVPNIGLSLAGEPDRPVSAELKYDHTGYTGKPENIFGEFCPLGTFGASSVFEFKKLVWDFNVFYRGRPPYVGLTMEYDPGHPLFTFVLTCPMSPVQTLSEPRWREVYEVERGEFSGTFHARHWKGISGAFAFIQYEPPPDVFQSFENSQLILFHTPQ